jgi:Fic family protein
LDVPIINTGENSQVQRGVSGKYEVTFTELVRPFVPYNLPPDPPVEISSARQRLLERAMVSLCRLDTIRLPHYAFIRREALLSMRINGNRSSLADVLLLELKGGSDALSDYVAALEYGLSRVRGGFPVSNTLMQEMHRMLFARAWRSVPSGEFRDLQNWVGGSLADKARFVPPPPTLVEGCMAELERFVQAPCLPLIKAALAHVQFHTIHPFFKGSGRMGRMLITLMTDPLLHLSQYFLDRQFEYHRLLDLVRAEGDWESWLDFFLEAAGDAASNTVAIAQRLTALFKADARRVQAVGRGASSALRVLQAMCERPVTSLGNLCERTGLAFPTTAHSVDRLERLGLVRKLSAGRRNRVFVYEGCVAILDC